MFVRPAVVTASRGARYFSMRPSCPRYRRPAVCRTSQEKLCEKATSPYPVASPQHRALELPALCFRRVHEQRRSFGSTPLSSDGTGETLSAQDSPSVPKSDKDLLEGIRGLVEQNRVVLFMKGTVESPQCGFSRRAVELLDQVGYDTFTFVNVLQSQKARELVKVYSGWPTIPQLFIDGKFVGGCDLMVELFESGELHRLLLGGDGSATADSTEAIP